MSAGCAEQVRSNRAPLERRDEDAVRSPRQAGGEVGLAHRQGQGAQVVAVKRQDVEDIELNFVIMLMRVQRVEVGNAIDTETTASPSITNCLN